MKISQAELRKLSPSLLLLLIDWTATVPQDFFLPNEDLELLKIAAYPSLELNPRPIPEELDRVLVKSHFGQTAKQDIYILWVVLQREEIKVKNQDKPWIILKFRQLSQIENE